MLLKLLVFGGDEIKLVGSRAASLALPPTTKILLNRPLHETFLFQALPLFELRKPGFKLTGMKVVLLLLVVTVLLLLVRRVCIVEVVVGSFTREILLVALALRKGFGRPLRKGC